MKKYKASLIVKKMQTKTTGMANAKKNLFIPDIHKYMNNCNPLEHWSLEYKILKPLWRAMYQLFLVLNIQLL